MAGQFVIERVAMGYYFILKARNGEVIARSGHYNSLAGCKNGIESVRRHAPDAKVVDLTEKKGK